MSRRVDYQNSSSTAAQNLRYPQKKYDSAIKLILMLDEFRFFTEKDKNSKLVNSHLVKNFNDILNKRYKPNTKNFSHENGENKHL